MTSVLVLGGARSGKSRRALALAEPWERRTLVATAEPLDDEMRLRIERHRQERGGDWSVVEAPLEIAPILADHADVDGIVVIDCLTLWLSNLMHHGRDVERETNRLGEVIGLGGELVLVSNEVGFGLVPETALGRSFRDAQGRLNQAVAAACERVELVAAGLPLVLKGH